MDPKVMIGIGVLALMQLFAAIQVMRAASERPDLTGLGRLIPVLLTLLIPVLGPLIGGRATDAGTRPMLFSLIGTVVCGAMVLLTTPPAAAPAPLQAAAPAPDATAGQPAQPAPDAAAPAEQPQPAAAPAQEPQPAAPAEQPQPAAPAEQPQPAAPAEQPQPAAAPAQEPQPAAPAEQPQPAAPAEQPQPAAAPAEKPAQPILAATPAAALAAGPLTDQAKPGQPNAAAVPVAELMVRPVRSEGQILITPTESGGTLTHHLARSAMNNTRLEFAAAYVAPPNSYAAPQLYLGGKVWYFNEKVDQFPPYPLADGEVVDGQTVQIPSVGGNFLAEVQFSGVEPGPDGHILKATLDVRIR